MHLGNIMPQRVKIILFIAVIFLTAMIVYLAISLVRPSADEVASGDTKANAVVWGVLTDANSKPLSNIMVRLGSQSGLSDPDGRYIIATEQVGRFPIYFDGLDSSIMYQSNDNEGAIIITNGLNLESNYTLTPLPGSVVSADPVASTPTPSTPIPTQPPGVSPPDAPSNVNAASNAVITWQDKSSNENGFEIYRSESRNGSFNSIGSVVANQTSYIDTTASRNKTYYYKVLGFVQSGQARILGGFSNIASVRITSIAKPTPTPAAPMTTGCTLDSVRNLPKSNENAIKYTYCFLLGRQFDAPGLSGWSGSITQNIVTLPQLPIWFSRTTEFQSTNNIKSLSNSQYVTFLYRKLLQREPDSGGLGHWVNVLNRGSTRDDVLIGFMVSSEFKQKHPIYFPPASSTPTPTPAPTPTPTLTPAPNRCSFFSRIFGCR